MNRGAEAVVTMVRTLVEFAVTTALNLVTPPVQRQAVPILALSNREWERAAARRRRLARG